MTASFGTSPDEHLEVIITGSNVMGLVAIQREFVDLSEYESPNCLGSFTTQNTLKRENS
jgi:hypothetical protein